MPFNGFYQGLPMSSSLYVISTELRELLDQVFENQGEIDTDLNEKMKLIENELMKKTDSIVSWVESKQDVIGLMKDKKKSIDEQIKKIESGLERFNSYIESSLIRMDKKSIEGTLCKITLPKKQLVVQIDNEDNLDLEYLSMPVIPKPSPDKLKIKNALKAGVEVIGASLVESKTISIKYGWK